MAPPSPEPQDIPTVERPQCRVCGALGVARWADLVDRRFGVAGRWRMVTCSSAECDAMWLDPAPAPDALGRLYERYYTHGPVPEASGTSDRPRRGRAGLPAIAARLRRFDERWWPTPRAARRAAAMRMQLVPADVLPGRLLEVGCGDGTHLEELARQGWEVSGQEIDPAAAAAAERRLGIDIAVGPLDSAPFAADSFDAILFHHVLEHLDDPVAALTRVAALLRPGGVLAVYTPNALATGLRVFRRSWRGLEPPRHLAVFGPAALRRLLCDSGYGAVDVRTQSPLASFMAIESVGDALAKAPRAVRALAARPASLAFHLYAQGRLRRDPHSGEELVAVARTPPFR